MFLSRSIRFLLRHSKDLYKKPPPAQTETTSKHTTSSTESTSNSNSKPISTEPIKTQSSATKATISSYPYKFGGIKCQGTNSPIVDMLVPDTSVFAGIYTSLLQNISNKQQQKLTNTIQISMLKALMDPNVHSLLINPDSPSRVLLHDFHVGIGAKFIRENHVGYIKQTTPDNMMHMYAPSNFNPGSFIMSGGIPMLLSINSTIITKTKLSLTGQPDQSQEAHRITFEYESKLVIKNMMGLMQSLPTLKSNPDINILKNLLFADEKPTWKIGNIDNYLKFRYD